jgi:putative aldouronate transport system permease protein
MQTLVNSVVRVIVGLTVNLLLVVLTAYPLSIGERRLRGRNAFLLYFFFTMLFNGGMIPTFLLVRDLNLINTLWALILPGAVQVFSIIIMINYMRGIPGELYEAAVLDGAGHFKVLMQIFLPLSLPCIATLIVFSAVGHWNSWFDGMLYLKSPTKWPLQTYLQSILADLQSLSQKIGMSAEEAQRYAQISDLSLISAQMFISIVPILLLYPFMQRYFISGIRLGSVKG